MSSTPPKLTDRQARALRVRAQGLTGMRPKSAVAVATHLGGLQAQVLAAAALGARVRTAGLVEADFHAALYEERTLARSWLHRGTLHVVAAEDLRWLLSLLGPRFAAVARTRRLQVGLDDAKCEAGLKLIRAALARNGPLQRAQLVEHLRRGGVALDPHGQDRPHLLQLAALRGLICHGPGGAGMNPTFVLLDDWIPATEALSEDAALERLATRYFGAFAPAGSEDLGTWAGLPIAQAGRALAMILPSLVEVSVGGRRAWVPRVALDEMPGPSSRPVVRLLPEFDNYLLGYRDRELTISPGAKARIYREGLIGATVVVGGKVIAGWKLARRKRGVGIDVEALESFTRAIQSGIDREVTDIKRFLGSS